MQMICLKGLARMKIPRIKLKLELTDESDNIQLGFKMAPESVGKRFQLGGEPFWIQDGEEIKCDSCKIEMTFYGQLDSINDDIIIGDCGMVYVFICFNCLESKSIIQTY
jgi:uncharacterized protein YwqG